MTRLVVASLTAFRERIGKPVERWRKGIFAVLIPKPKAGIVKAFARKKR